MTEEEFNKIFNEARHYACQVASVLKTEYDKLSEDTKEYLDDFIEMTDKAIELLIIKLAYERAIIEKDEADDQMISYGDGVKE